MTNVKELISLNPLMKEQLKIVLSQISYEKPGLVMDLIAQMLSADASELQEILETYDLNRRAEKLLLLLRKEIELAQLQEKIQKQIDEKINRQQKEFFLREQLKAIKKELGLEKDDKTAEIEKIEKKNKISDTAGRNPSGNSGGIGQASHSGACFGRISRNPYISYYPYRTALGSLQPG